MMKVKVLLVNRNTDSTWISSAMSIGDIQRTSAAIEENDVVTYDDKEPVFDVGPRL